MQCKKRRSIIVTVAALAALPLASPSSHAQTWPGKPIRLIVPYAAGGFADLRARQLAQAISGPLGTNIIVENKPGGGGVIGTDLIARAEPDGYTIGMGNLAPLAVNDTLMKRLPYDPMKDLQPVILLEKAPLFLMTHPNSGITSIKDLIAKAKASPGSIGFASSGIGGAHHLSGEMFGMIAGVDMMHVPYKGGAPATSDLLAGHVPTMFEMGYSALSNIRSGKLRPLAVSSKKRLAVTPDIPTLDEAGIAGFESYNWQGVVVPAGTPAHIVERLNKELNAALNSPAIRKSIEDTGAQVAGGSAAEFGAFIKSETALWARVIRNAKIEAQ